MTKKEWKLETDEDAYNMCHELWTEIGDLKPSEMKKLAGNHINPVLKIKIEILKAMGVKSHIEGSCPYCELYFYKKNGSPCPFIISKRADCRAICAKRDKPFGKFMINTYNKNWIAAKRDAKSMVKWIERTKVF